MKCNVKIFQVKKKNVLRYQSQREETAKFITSTVLSPQTDTVLLSKRWLFASWTATS